MFFDFNAVKSTYIDYLIWVRYSARCVGTNRLAYIIGPFPSFIAYLANIPNENEISKERTDILSIAHNV